MKRAALVLAASAWLAACVDFSRQLELCIALGRCADDVTGTRTLRHVTETGVIEIPIDLSHDTVTAFVPRDGGFVAIAGAGDDSGHFSIPHVPAGSYWFGLVEPGYLSRYVWTTSHQLDLSELVAGRPNVQSVDAGTRLVLALSQLLPWARGDSVQVISAGAAVTDSPSPRGCCPDGPTQATPTRGSSSIGRRFPRPRASTPANSTPRSGSTSAGDQTVVYQMSTEHNDAGQAFAAALRVLATQTSPPLTIADGDVSTVAGVMAPLPGSINTTATLVRLAYDGLSPAMNAAATPVSYEVSVRALLAAPDHDYYGARSPIVDGVFAASGTLPARIDLPISSGNPFPSSWDVLGAVVYWARVPLALPLDDGGTALGSIEAVSNRLMPSSALTGDLQPGLSPVRSVLINGHNGFDVVSGAGPTPTISWSLPTQGTPTAYEIFIELLQPNGGALNLSAVGVLFTRESSLQVPPGILQPGSAYVFIIRAFTAAIDLDHTPFHAGPPPLENTDAITNLVYP